jgi:outer membrane receptor protein involved in Fe transport
VISPSAYDVKLSGGLYYKLTSNIEVSLVSYFGTGNTTYTGTDRYSIKALKLAQHKLEFKSRNWYVRAYTTRENSGESFDAVVTTRLFNEAWKPTTTWATQYLTAFQTALATGSNYSTALITARTTADQGRPTGYLGNNPLFQQVAGTPIKQGGGLFLDKSALNVVEGQYNLTEDLKLPKGTDFLVGGSLRQFVLNSQGTLFADTASKIHINESGVYGQLSQKVFGDILKLSVSGRYDKNTNFDGKFTPRASAVIKFAKDNNLRFSYQTAYRFPTTQNQWINLLVSGGVRLMGGLQQLRDFYNFSGNPVYTLASFQAFAASGNPALLQVQAFDKFKPESSKSYEVGYKGLIAKRLLVDAYYYWGQYQDMIGSTTVVQSNNGTIPGLATSRTIYNISINNSTIVKTHGWGASAEYQLPANFSINANVYSDVIGDVPTGFVAYFNTPKYRANIGFSNSGILLHNTVGFGLMYRYQDSFFYEGTFGVGDIPSTRTLDGMISIRFPESKSILKMGGSNIINKYYTNGIGAAKVGGLYYISYAWNVF